MFAQNPVLAAGEQGCALAEADGHSQGLCCSYSGVQVALSCLAVPEWLVTWLEKPHLHLKLGDLKTEFEKEAEEACLVVAAVVAS